MTDEEIRAICHELLDLIGETRTTQSRKLEQAVGQLVIADGVLAGRIDVLERIASTFQSGNSAEDTIKAVEEAGFVLVPRKVFEAPPKRSWWKL